MPWAAYPLPPRDPVLDRVAEVLNPVLVPLSFAAGQLGSSGPQAQVIYCRGMIERLDGGCVDLVIDLERASSRRITDVRYYGCEGERMHLSVPPGSHLDSQLEQLRRTVASDLGQD